MLIGNYPVADEIGDDDILIISKDGVHLLQVTVRQAGFGGGLKWWVETETEIYREYEASELGYASLVKVLVGTQWECDAYSFMNTYYIPELFPQVCMLSDINKLSQPENRLGKIMAMNVRTQETPDNCGPDTCLAHRNTYVHYGPYYTYYTNYGSNVGLKVSTSCQKSNDYPVVTIAGCKMYSVSEEHLIKNFPMFTYTDYARATDWNFSGSGCGEYIGGQGGHNSGFDGHVAAMVNCPTKHGGGVFVNGELGSLGEQYGNFGWFKYWDPIPLDKHGDYDDYHAASDGWHGLQAYSRSDGIGPGGCCIHNGATDSYSASAVYNALTSIDFHRTGCYFVPIIHALNNCFATGVDPYDILEAAGTDDPSAAINQILEAHRLWTTEHDWHPKPESEWWTGDENVKEVTQYTVTLDIVSPFTFATEHEEPVTVIYNTYGYEPDPVRTELNVNDYTRETEYNYFDRHSNLPYGSNINPLATWQTWNDPIHDPGGSSGNWRIDLTRNNWGYWGHWTNDPVHETGMYDINVMDPIAFTRINNGGIAWDVTFVPITRNWFDRDSENRAVNRKGYFDTEWNQLEYPFSIRDHEGNFHTYPDYVYQEDDDPLATHGYNYLAFDHPYSASEYDYRYDTKEPDERIVQDICVGKFDIDDKLTYDFSLGKHWIFDKEFLQENLEEHVFVDEDHYTFTETLYDNDITHVPPHPDQKRIYHMYNYVVRKGYTAKTDMGEKALRRARKCFDTFLENSRSRIVFPKVAEGDSGPKIKTSIGVDGDAFWTGYVTETPDPEEPEVMVKTEHKQFNVDQDTGDVDTQGKYMIKGVDIRDILQEKLVAGKGISLHSDGKGTTTVTNTMMDTALDELVDTFRGSAGIIVGKTTDPTTHEDEVHFNLNHDLIPITNETKQQSEHPEDLIPVQVHRTSLPAQYRMVDELYFDRTNVGYHNLMVDNGLELSDSQNTWRIKSTALDNIRVNGVKQEKVFDLYPPPGQETGDGYYVDIQIDPSGGGGVEYKIPQPMLDYANKSEEIRCNNQEGTTILTAPADGVLYVYDRKSNYNYINVIVDGTFTFTFGNMYGKTNTYDDVSNMLPLSKGQVVTLGTKNVATGGSGYPQFYFIPYVTTTSDAESFVLPVVDYSTAAQTFTTSDIPSSGSYTFTASIDGVLCNDPSYGGYNYSGTVTIKPLDDEDQPIDTYMLANSPGSTSNTHEMDWQIQFPVQKGKKYNISKSSSTACGSMRFTLFAYETVSKADDVIFAPYLDYDNAEVIHMQSGSNYEYVAITPPTITDKPGILISIAEPSTNTQSRRHKIKLSDTYPCNDQIYLVSRLETNCVHRHIIVPAYEDYTWKVEGGSQAFWTEEDLIFVPFADYSPPGVDRIVANGKSLVKDRICDLSELYNKIADLEARVEALENPT